MSRIPPPDPFVNYYNPKSPEVKRVDSKAENFAEIDSRLRQQGWGRERFAQALFNKKLGVKVFSSKADVDAAIKQGWLTEPILNPNVFTSREEADAAIKDGFDPAKVEIVHPDAVHPHYKDEHRLSAQQTGIIAKHK